MSGFDLGQVASFILALVAVAGAITSWRLGKRGQHTAEIEQAAKRSLEERVTAFDELESLNDRLEKENARLRELATEAEVAGDARLARQAHRCREQLEQMTATVALLQGVVLDELTRAAAGDSIEKAARHVAEDHPESPTD